MSIKANSGAYLLPDDRALLPIYEAIERAGRTLVAHLAEPNGAWLPLDSKNPESTYYSNNPQWHMFGKAGAGERTIFTARDQYSPAIPSYEWSGAIWVAMRTTSSAWQSGWTPIPTSPSIQPCQSVTSHAVTASKSVSSSITFKTASSTPPITLSVAATVQLRRKST